MSVVVLETGLTWSTASSTLVRRCCCWLPGPSAYPAYKQFGGAAFRATLWFYLQRVPLWCQKQRYESKSPVHGVNRHLEVAGTNPLTRNEKWPKTPAISHFWWRRRESNFLPRHTSSVPSTSICRRRLVFLLPRGIGHSRVTSSIHSWYGAKMVSTTPPVGSRVHISGSGLEGVRRGCRRRAVTGGFGSPRLPVIRPAPPSRRRLALPGASRALC